ncbi:hypothetical protein M0802_016296 [Mischocyttarus mexicanus]|nr:hypothetical protein M0802_016296 [Mischocyttarus mexicanus]
MLFDEQIYADLLPEEDNCSDSESDSDSGCDIIERRFKNKERPIISESESGDENSAASDWSEVDFKPYFHACLERFGLQVPCTPDNDDNNNSSTKNKAWVDTNVVELKKLLRLVILIGIVKKTRIRRLLVNSPWITYTYFWEYYAKKPISAIMKVLAL